MKLSEKDKDQFFKLYHSLLLYANDKFNILQGVKDPDDVFHGQLDKVNELRMKMYDEPEIINTFIAENPRDFEEDELEIIGNFKHFIRERFIIVKYLKKYSVLLSQDKTGRAFGVLGLNSTFEDMLGPYLPVMIDAVLLPFKDSIVYDGIINPYRIQFGSTLKMSINRAYQEVKAKHGIITSLPFEKGEEETDDLEMLKVYMKSQYNRDVYWEEIEELKNRDHSLLVYYHQKMGKIHARDYKKRLREMNLIQGWFGILEGIIIGSGTSKKELIENVSKIVPQEKMDLVYMFEIKS